MFKKLLTVAIALIAISGCKGGPSSSGSFGSGTWVDGRLANGTILPGTQADLQVHVGDKLYFPYNSSSLTAEAKAVLDKQAVWWAEGSRPEMIIEGHCDERGTREYNLALGERRANAVKKYLISKGVDSEIIQTISYGKERPAVIGTGEETWKFNRRGVTVVKR
jgi:peptidoglycan-associated lipoprotein